MVTKLQIAKFLILFGFLLNLMNYSIELFDLYIGDSREVVYSIDDSEGNLDPIEKESSEKEDFKEKDKISQYYAEEMAAISKMAGKHYPEFYIQNSPVFLEYKTPPPEIV